MELSARKPDIYMCGLAIRGGEASYAGVVKPGVYEPTVGLSFIQTVECLASIQRDSIQFKYKVRQNISDKVVLAPDQLVVRLRRMRRFNSITVRLAYHDYENVSLCTLEADRLVRIESENVTCRRHSIDARRHAVHVTFTCATNESSSGNDVAVIVDTVDGVFLIASIGIYEQPFPVRFRFEPYVCYATGAELHDISAFNRGDNRSILSYDDRLQNVVTDRYERICLMMKRIDVNGPVPFTFRTGEWRRVKSLKVIVGSVSYVGDIELNISLLAVNGSYESDSSTTLWINVLNSCLESLVYEKIINITGYLIY